MGILDFFRGAQRQPRTVSADSDTIRRISAAIDQLSSERARYIAAFAFVLGRVANADLEISSEEVAEMERIVERVGGIPEDQAALVVQIAKAQHKLFGATENFAVTREFNRLSTHAQKKALLHCLYAVSSSDHSISVREDNEIRVICKELHLDHSEFIAVRSVYKEHLSVLQG